MTAAGWAVIAAAAAVYLALAAAGIRAAHRNTRPYRNTRPRRRRRLLTCLT